MNGSGMFLTLACGVAKKRFLYIPFKKERCRGKILLSTLNLQGTLLLVYTMLSRDENRGNSGDKGSGDAKNKTREENENAKHNQETETFKFDHAFC